MRGSGRERAGIRQGAGAGRLAAGVESRIPGTTPGRVARLGDAFEDLGCDWCAGSALSVFKPGDQAGEQGMGNGWVGNRRL